MTQWAPDILGVGFEYTTFDLGSDGELAPSVAASAQVPEPPHLAATLVRSLPAPRTMWARFTDQQRAFEQVDVLYVHGWSDYFFQRGLARFWTDRGARFFALDLRRYGRSLREGQTPGYIANLADYDTEIDLAIDEIRSTGPGRALVLLGHSTGGLVLSLWAGRNAGRTTEPGGQRADALILNSPWLEFQLASRGRQLIRPLVNFGAKYYPMEAAPQIDYGFYTRAQHEVGPNDELEGINLAWRPEQTHAIHSGWLRAILDGHAQVQAGLGITIPVCTLLSARFAIPTRWSDELTRADTVLDVEEIARASLRLGDSVTVERIDGALHDVFLSAEAPRAEAYDRLERWMRGWLASRVQPAR